MGKISDTSAEAERVLIKVYRKMAPGTKWSLLGRIFRTARVLHEAGVRIRKPEASDREVLHEWRKISLGPLSVRTEESLQMIQPKGDLGVLREVIEAFTALGIPYAVGGSLASSVHGIPRFTQDADIMVDIFSVKAPELVDRFGPDYYIDLSAVLGAIDKRACFNIIHTTSGFKVDVFVIKERPFERSVMQRRVSEVLPDRPGLPLVLVSPEDIVLLKLEWYRMGEGISDRQWQDVLGVLKVQAERLDQGYLDRWANDLRVGHLLARAREEVRDRT